MQRRVDGPDGDGQPARLEHAVEVFALQRQQFVQGLPPFRFGVGEDHPLYDGDPPLAEEHVLGPAEADPARAERIRNLRLIGLIGVGVDAQPPELVGPRQQLVESPVDVRL